MKIHYLQISDIHFQFQNYETEVMRDALLNYLNELKKDNPFNFVLLTGDVSHQGKEYHLEIKNYLESLVEVSDLAKEDIHLIPGNHDVTRNSIRSYIIKGILGESNPSEALENAEEDIFEKIIEGQDNFFDFYKEFKNEDYPRKDLHFVKKNENYNLLLLNTSFMSDKQGEEGTLLTDRKKVYKALKDLKENTNLQNSLNIAVGHHTLDCLNEKEKKALVSNFDEFDIDIYMSGHVHNPSYTISADQSNESLLELVSGANLADSYSEPGFLSIEVDLESGNTNAIFHIWDKDGQFWTTNNRVGKRTSTGKLNYSIEKFKKIYAEKTYNDSPEIANAESEALKIDENDFKDFIIDFHEEKQNPNIELSSSEIHKIGLEEKFNDMKCGKTFKKQFDDYSIYFGIINQIMESTAYVSADKKDLIAEVIIDKYLTLHNRYESGDEIFINIANDLQEEIQEVLSYKTAQTKRYIKILICWCIYECEIFNDIKV